MDAPTSEVGYTSAINNRGFTKSIWTCGGIGKKKILKLPSTGKSTLSVICFGNIADPNFCQVGRGYRCLKVEV
jgi:hypothetical protein